MSDAFALARARRALSEAGLDLGTPLTRASSVTNEVWFAGDLVVRVNRQPNQRLRREATLGPMLPPAVRYPEVVAYGGQLGADWLILKRRPGTALSRAWPTLEWPERRAAIRQLAEILQALHQVVAPHDLTRLDPPQLVGGEGLYPVEPVLVALDRARSLAHVDHYVLDELRRIVEADARHLEPFHQPTLVHGDLTFENVLWDGERISALLDFEWSHQAPPDMELDILLRFCSFPYLHVAEDYEHLTRADDYAPIPWWLADDYPTLFATPHLFERLRIYSIGYDLRELLMFPPARPPRELSRHHPYNRLVHILDGASHLDELAGHVLHGSGPSGAYDVGGPPPLSPERGAGASSASSALPARARSAPEPVGATSSSGAAGGWAVSAPPPSRLPTRRPSS